MPDAYDGYNDGYQCISDTPSVTPKPSMDKCGYHRYTAPEVFSGISSDGRCPSPYSRGILANGGINGVIRDREEQLINTTGKPVTLLRRQFTGPRCPCYSSNRGRSRARCDICYGTSYVPGYIPYVNQKDSLGRIKVRFEPYAEQLDRKEQGAFQEVTINAWTLSAPIVRQRDVLIVYDTNGEEEFRYEIRNVTRNDIFGGEQGAQKFTVRRLDPTEPVYLFDPFKVPDLTDISIDLSAIVTDYGNIISDLPYQQLGTQDDGDYPNLITEPSFGDGTFAFMYTEGYKISYETNFRRILEFKEPLSIPDFNEDGFLLISDGYGPIFKDVNGNVIRFSTPQQFESNSGSNPLEVIAAEKKKNFLSGWYNGAKDGVKDGEIELRARGYEW
jgi:hypothetical protein